jgi:hypothetical protein
MKSLILASLLAAHPGQSHAPDTKMRLAAVCFKTGEQQSTMSKICYYDCVGTAVAITIGAVELCPLTINR